jgi:hypothetical protein
MTLFLKTHWRWKNEFHQAARSGIRVHPVAHTQQDDQHGTTSNREVDAARTDLSRLRRPKCDVERQVAQNPKQNTHHLKDIVDIAGNATFLGGLTLLSAYPHKIGE